MRIRSRAEQKAMFSRLSSYSDFNRNANAEFVKGIPSSREAVFTNKTMEIDTPLLGNLSPYKRDVFGIDISDNKFSVDPEIFNKVINMENSLRHYSVYKNFYQDAGISERDFIEVQEAKRISR